MDRPATAAGGGVGAPGPPPQRHGVGVPRRRRGDHGRRLPEPDLASSTSAPTLLRQPDRSRIVGGRLRPRDGRGLRRRRVDTTPSRAFSRPGALHRVGHRGARRLRRRRDRGAARADHAPRLRAARERARRPRRGRVGGRAVCGRGGRGARGPCRRALAVGARRARGGHHADRVGQARCRGAATGRPSLHAHSGDVAARPSHLGLPRRGRGARRLPQPAGCLRDLRHARPQAPDRGRAGPVQAARPGRPTKSYLPPPVATVQLRLALAPAPRREPGDRPARPGAAGPGARRRRSGQWRHVRPRPERQPRLHHHRPGEWVRALRAARQPARTGRHLCHPHRHRPSARGRHRARRHHAHHRGRLPRPRRPRAGDVHVPGRRPGPLPGAPVVDGATAIARAAHARARPPRQRRLLRLPTRRFPGRVVERRRRLRRRRTAARGAPLPRLAPGLVTAGDRPDRRRRRRHPPNTAGRPRRPAAAGAGRSACGATGRGAARHRSGGSPSPGRARGRHGVAA